MPMSAQFSVWQKRFSVACDPRWHRSDGVRYRVLVPAIGRTLIQPPTDSSPSKGRQGYLPVDEGANVDKTVSSHFLWEEGTKSVNIFKNFWLATEALSVTR